MEHFHSIPRLEGESTAQSVGMCGRFVNFTVAEELLSTTAEIPGLAPVRADGPLPTSRYNIGPTMPIVALAREHPGRTGTIAATVRWGLIPQWAREVPTTPFFNARAETWQSKPTFRDGLPCTIPMNGWYEWKGCQPYFVSFGDEAPLFTVAGLWARWGDIVSATILTTDAVGKLTNLHHRMPRVLADDEVSDWLGFSAWAADGDVGMTSAKVVDKLTIRPVNRAVGNVANEGPHLLNGPDGAAPGHNEELF